jgi:hypothetical protein
MSKTILLQIKTTPPAAISNLVYTVKFESKINDSRIPIAILSNITSKDKITVTLDDGRYYVKIYVQGQTGVTITLEGNGAALFDAIVIPNERIINEEHSFRIESE